MGLSRSEIELIVKAQYQAKAAFTALSDDLNKVTGGAVKASAGLDDVAQKGQKAGQGAQAASVAFGILAAQLLTGLKNAFGEAVGAANALDSGLIGLSSVAKAFGQDSDKAKEAAQQLASDGLMSVSEAAVGLKNLLASGFNLDQAVILMNRFKDSAAFGRQAALGFGQAVSSATEGIKNGNSILVDNAGVTKNLSQILVEAGHSATDLSKASSDANIRMALFKGIIKETNPQVGDAAKLLGTAAGEQAKFNAQTTIAYQQIGKSLQPVLKDLFQILGPVVKAIADNADALVKFGMAAAAVAAPLAAARAAAMLGIPSFATLGTTLAATAASATLLQKALFIFAAWEVGQGIGQFIQKSREAKEATDGWKESLDEKGVGGAFGRIADLLPKLGELYGKLTTDSETNAQITLQIAAAQARANQLWGDAAPIVRNFDEALKLLGSTADMVGPKVSKIWGGDRSLHVPTAAEAAAVSNVFDTMANAGKRAEERIAGWRKELALVQGAGGLPTLRQELDRNVLSTKELAADFGISEDAIKFFADGIKKAGEANKEASKQAKDHAEAMKIQHEWLQKLREATFEQTQAFNGLNQAQALQTSSQMLDSIVRRYEAEHEAITENQDAEMQRTEFAIEAAKDRGASIQEVAALEEKLGRQHLQQSIELARKEFIERTAWLDRTTEYGRQEYEAQEQLYQAKVDKMTEGFLLGEQQKREEIRRTTTLMGRLWTDAQSAVQGTLVEVKRSFGEMLVGAKSFGDGFMDIWHSLRDGIMEILQDILDFFLQKFLRGIINGIANQRLGSSLGSLFGTGGQGVAAGSGFAGLGSLFGMGASSATTVISGTGIPVVAGAGGAGAGVGGAGISGALSAAAGPAAGGLLGGLVGYKSRSRTLGVLSGAGAGAGIGAMFGGPVGALIGGGVGAVAGLIGGILGRGKERKENAEATDQVAAYRAELIKTYGSLEQIQRIGKVIGVDLAAAFGDQGKKGLEHFKGLMDSFVAGQEELSGALEHYGLTWKDLGKEFQQSSIEDAYKQLVGLSKTLQKAGVDQTTILQKQAGEYSELYQEIVSTGTEAPESLQPILEKLIEMGLLVDDAGNKVTDLAAVSFAEPLVAQWDAATAAAQRYRDVVAGIPGAPVAGVNPGDYSGGTIEGGAAGGVIARRPGLVLFGEGGETEVGGPRSFFRDVFEGMGIKPGGMGGSAAPMYFVIDTAAGVVRQVEKAVYRGVEQRLRTGMTTVPRRTLTSR